MKPIRKLLVLSLIFAFALAAAVSEIGQAQGPDDTDSDGSSGVVAALRSDLSPKSREFLSEHGVTGLEVTFEQQEGYVLVNDGEAWVIAESRASKTVSAEALDFGIGLCEGRFYGPWTVAENAEWGAENSCATLGPTDVYRHSISSKLMQKSGLWNWTNKGTALSPLESLYSKTVSAHRSTSCAKSSARTYRLTVEVMLKSIKYAPIHSLERILSCDFN